MKPQFVSVVAVLFCCAILVVVAFFGYTRYQAAQAEDAAFRERLKSNAADQQAPLAARMPEQLSSRADSTGGEPSASPQPAKQ